MEVGELLDLLKVQIYKNSGAKLPEVSQFLCEQMYFYWENFNFETYQANQGAKTLSGGQAPWPHAGYCPVYSLCKYFVNIIVIWLKVEF